MTLQNLWRTAVRPYADLGIAINPITPRKIFGERPFAPTPILVSQSTQLHHNSKRAIQEFLRQYSVQKQNIA
ncbi:MAG: hypothetical protein J7642_18140 [Cyanobacteria bacterium SBC]|nr:hypothetical protein [Cyanobacteria bacterium SBC]